MIPSFFLAHIYYWGEIHRKNMGRERADFISPAASAAKENIPFTLHQDTPVIKPDMLETVWCAVQRKTKEGHLMGEEERISLLQALQAVTINGAYEYSEELQKGTIQKGKKADFVILDQNPMETDLDAVPKIQVLATIKEGKVIWKKE